MENKYKWTTEKLNAYKEWAAYLTKQADKAELDFCYWLLTLKDNTPEVTEKLEHRIDELEKELL